MVGVAEQFGHLRNYLGQVLSVMSLVRFLKDTANWMMGRHSKSGNNLDADSFQSFVNGSGGGSGGGGGSKPRTSSRPIWVFFAFVIGFPWLVTKLITRIQKKRLEQSGDAAFNNNGVSKSLNGYEYMLICLNPLISFLFIYLLSSHLLQTIS